jgi:L-ascorbate metabolism protein UlaG (beta-lactamase superfamily)
LLLTWLGAAGFRVDTAEGATLLIDPYLSRPENAIPPLSIQLADLTPIDEIFLTNGRFDHSLDTPALTEQTGAIIHAPEPVCQRLAEIGVSSHNLTSTAANESKQIGSLVWQALPSLVNQADSSLTLRALLYDPNCLAEVKALDHHCPLGAIVAYLFQAEGLSVIHFGSAAWIESEISDLEPDIALLPVETDPQLNGSVLQLITLLNPKMVIPHHWDDYYPPLSQVIDLTRFETILKTIAPHTKIYIPTIGESFNPADLL